MRDIGNMAAACIFLTLWLFLVVLVPVFGDGAHAEVQVPTVDSVSDDDRLLQLWLEAFREVRIRFASTLPEDELLERQSQLGVLSQEELSRVATLREQLLVEQLSAEQLSRRTERLELHLWAIREGVPIAWDQKNYIDLYDYLLTIRTDDTVGIAVQTVVQISLGIIYAHQDAPQWLGNATEARRWFFRAAQAGSSFAQYRLALMLKSVNSHGEALQWAKRARSTLEEDVLRVKPTEADVDNLISSLNEMAGNRELSASSVDDSADDRNRRWLGAGSGFYINEDGYILTAAHNVRGKRPRPALCDALSVMLPMDSIPRFVTIVDEMIDDEPDLALLLDESLRHASKEAGGERGTEWASFRAVESEISVGEDIVVVGFPLNSVMLLEVYVTVGIVSALSAVRGDSRQMIISAWTATGNSGGPVLDSNGDVVGVSARGAFANHPDGPNTAVRLKWIREFLNQSGVKTSTGSLREGRMSVADVARIARDYTVLVECWENME